MIKAATLRAVKASAAAADMIRRPPTGVVILLYHRVGGRSGIEVDLPVSLFAEQMEFLSQERRAVSLDEAVETLTSPEPPDRDPVVVTFDDGTADFAEDAVPVLERFGIPATIYLATDHIERGAPFPNEGRPLSWAALRDTLATGLVTVGSHTHTHRILANAGAAEVAEELDRSRSLIEERLGVAADHFAYPKAVPGSAIAETAVRDRFRSAAIGGTRPNAYGRADLYRLTRSAIQSSDGRRWFRRKLAGGMSLEGTLRSLVNRRRYAEMER
jgi:peptidoglycan/xylan/chitin deacetylase (PgdA/CDA1 family)